MDEVLEEAAHAVMSGGVIAIPTDTVYGLACDPSNLAAVGRIFAIKRRPAALELSLLAASKADLERMVEFSSYASELAERYWPGPLSLVLPASRDAALAVPRGGTTLMVRVPDHEVLLNLLRLTGPLASTSANRHGAAPAVSAAEVEAALGSEVALVVDGGRGGGRASTIIDCAASPPRLLREGPISADEVLSRQQ